MDYVLRCLKRAADNSYAWSVTPAEAGALVAEVERLRSHAADLRVMVDGLENAAHEERAAVVAWLEKAGWMPSLVEVFRRVEHRREGEP
jgi:biopolymer transport protein ExbD